MILVFIILTVSHSGEWLFTDNETNIERLFGQPNLRPFHKDGFHRYVVNRELDAVNPAQQGTKAARHLSHTLASGEEWIVECRLRSARHGDSAFSDDFQTIFSTREHESKLFFESTVPNLSADDRLIHGSGAAGLLWCKKYYGWSVLRWLDGIDLTGPKTPSRTLRKRQRLLESLACP
jgi:hypothetical protein